MKHVVSRNEQQLLRAGNVAVGGAAAAQSNAMAAKPEKSAKSKIQTLGGWRIEES
jgi:hypothetical protein